MDEVYDLTEIIPNLYLSSISPAINKDLLLSKNIRHIVNASQYPNYYPTEFTYLELDIEDNPNLNISEHFPSVNEFIYTGLFRNEGVLVHCYAGISRSTTLIIAYLIEKEGVSLEEAYQFVKSKRNIIQPNPGFWNQLKEYYNSLKPWWKFW